MKGNVNFPVNYSTLFLEIYEQVFHVKCYMSWFPSRFVHIFSQAISFESNLIWLVELVDFMLFIDVHTRMCCECMAVRDYVRIEFTISSYRHFFSRFELALPYQLMLLSTGRLREYTPSAYMKHCCTLQASSTWDERSHRYRQLKW